MTEIPTLETERLRLVPPSLEFKEAEAAFMASERSHFVGGPMPAHRIWRIIAVQRGHWDLLGYGMFGVIDKATGQPAGMVGLWGPEPWPEPELAYHVYAPFEGRGYVTEAARAVRDWNFGALGRDRLVSMIDPANGASQAVARKLGGYNTGERFSPEQNDTFVDIWRYDAPGTGAAA